MFISVGLLTNALWVTGFLLEIAELVRGLRYHTNVAVTDEL